MKKASKRMISRMPALLPANIANLASGASMEKLGYILRKAFFKPVATRIQRKRDLTHQTYSSPSLLRDGKLEAYVAPLDPQVLISESEAIRPAVERVMEHEFDLLGSGPAQVRHGMKCPGLQGVVHDTKIDTDFRAWNNCNQANMGRSRYIANMITEPYTPIDWALDFKSGYRWSERVYYEDIGRFQARGADIKVPWELARMQWLPWLGWAHGLESGRDHGTGASGAVSPYQREFTNQTLDFIAANPPRFGVNWNCAMEVAIRAANMLLAYDIFKSYAAEFDEEFELVFRQSIYDHAYHIRHNLEATPFFQGNHYLANIVGLLIAAAYLPGDRLVDSWLSFSMAELQKQALAQFLDDGANFEASTAYHDFALEMLIIGATFMLALPESRLAQTDMTRDDIKQENTGQPDSVMFMDEPGIGEDLFPLSPSLLNVIKGGVAFSSAITMGYGSNILIGDNDSGRFFKLFPPGNGKTGKTSMEPPPVILARGLGAESEESGNPIVKFIKRLIKRPLKGQVEMNSNSGAQYSSDGAIRLRSFPDFGLFIYSTDRYTLTVRCGPVGQNGRGGHGHNDQLSITLFTSSRPLLVDPGTYVYTPLPEYRNRFRSTETHNTLWIPGQEQNPWPGGRSGLFRMKDRSRAKVTLSGPETFAGKSHGFSALHRRAIYFRPDLITVEDYCPAPAIKAVNLLFHPEVSISLTADLHTIMAKNGIRTVRFRSKDSTWTIKESVWAPEYGVLEKTFQATLLTRSDRIEWSALISDN